MNCMCSIAGMRPSRRSFVAGLICTVVASGAPAPVKAAPESASAEDDERFMRMALMEARRADFPFGAVIVRDGRVVARGRNMGRRLGDPTAHGEMVAIRRLATAHRSAALRGSTLYTPGEPCAMCMGAIRWRNSPPGSIRSC
jgi:deoxycytidylate deaminase